MNLAALTPCAIALNDLVETMKAIDRLNSLRRDLTPTEDRRYSMLEDRRYALENQIETEVRQRLGVDYGVLWHAVTPK